MIHFLIILLLCTVSFANAAHLKSLSAIAYSSALSAIKHETFSAKQSPEPYLFVATHNHKTHPKALRFDHAVKPFNNGHGLLIAAIAHTQLRNDKKISGNIAQELLNAVDIEPLKALLDKKREEGMYGPSAFTKKALQAGAKRVKTSFEEKCKNEKDICSMRMNNLIEGEIFAAFRCAHSYRDDAALLYRYGITSDWQSLIGIENYSSDEVGADGLFKINRFDDCASRWYMVMQKYAELDPALIGKFKRTLTSVGSGTSNITPFVEAFALNHLSTKKSTRLMMMDLQALRAAVYEGNA